MRRVWTSLVLLLCLARAASAQTGGTVTTSLTAPAKVTAAWTSATAQDTTLVATATGLAHAVITVSTSGAIAGGALIFEVDDGAGTWYLTPVVQTAGIGAGQTMMNGYSLVAANVAFEVGLPGWTQVRVRLNPAIAGAGTVTVSILTSAGTTEPAVYLSPVNGQSPTTVVIPGFQAFLQQLQRATSWSLRGNLGQSITSTGTALDVNVKYPPAVGDACAGAKSNAPISQTANAVIVNGTGGRRVAICAITVVGADAENISLVEGTGATCATGTAAIIGGTTAANGPNLAANGGFTSGSGVGAIAVQAKPGNDVCLFQSGGGRVAGNLTYAVQ